MGANLKALSWIPIAPYEKLGGRPRVYPQLVEAEVSPRDVSRGKFSMQIRFRHEVAPGWARVDAAYGGDHIFRITSGNSLGVRTTCAGWRQIDCLDVSPWYNWQRWLYLSGEFLSLTDDEMILKLTPQPLKFRPRKKKKK